MKTKSLHRKLLFLLFQLCSLVGISQQDVTSVVTARYNDYQKGLLPEKLYVHTDKDFYITGQLIWFKIYLVDGFYNKPLDLSKVAYVEVLDQNNTPVLKTKVELKEKGGDGSIQLPLTLNSGYYTFRAYTNWMKNFGPSSFFEKRIAIVNPLKALPASEKASPLYTLDLFPEGGNLIEGFPSKVGFALKNKYGAGVSGKGFLLDENNDTLSIFTPYKFGLGSFDLTPSSIHSYKVVFVLPDLQTVARPLPRPVMKGYAMNVEEEAGVKIKVTVRTNLNSNNNALFLLATTQHRVWQAISRQALDGVAAFIIDKNKLPGGVTTFTVFNEQKQPVAERLFFVPPSDNEAAGIKSSKTVYGQRDQVSLAVDGSSVGTDAMSISVYKIDSLQLPPASNIRTWLLLESELNQPVEEPAFYFSGNTAEVKRAADNLMLTAGWRKFDWDKAINSSPVIQYPLENSGHIITARVIDTKTGSPAKEIPVYLSVPQTRYKLYTNEPSAEGLVRFEVKDFYGPGELILQTNLERDTTYRVEVLNPFSELYKDHSYIPFVLSESKKRLLENYSVGMQAQHIYYPEAVQRYYAPNITDTFMYFGKALNGYNLDDYTRFTTMEEVLREYVREINVGIRGGGELKFKLLNTEQKRNLTQNLLVTVDGVPIFNPDVVFKYDPLKFKRIDVNTKGFILGTSYFNGMASFLTYPENFEGIELDPKAVAVDYEGLQLQRVFYAPDYSFPAGRNSRIPDLRTTLLWKPNVDTNEVQFFTGDNKGRYIAVLEGLTKQGKTITATTEFEVH